MHVHDSLVAAAEAVAGLDLETVSRLAARLPRYTSYPTANHFSNAVGPEDYAAWLATLEDDAALSLYVHIPFCESLCWYCACSTKATRQYAPVAHYLDVLEAEIETVRGLTPRRHRLTHLHWGGGSPDILRPDDMRRLGQSLARAFNLEPETEFGVEVDPRLMTRAKADALVEIGVNRISVGLQDFEPAVQQAIGRIQSHDVSRRAIDMFRDRGVTSVNVDLVYGLPRQTEASLARTMAQVLALAPDRIAIFGYAHLPQRAHNQRLIDEGSLPGALERFRFSRLLEGLLSAAGYVSLGMDHFARPSDRLATQPLNRNFQGYTTDCAETLIGLGASAIGRFPQGFVQNAVAAGDYQGRVETGGLATVRGWRLMPDDRTRAHAIERLMCDFVFSESDLLARFGEAAAPVIAEARDLTANDPDGFTEVTADGFKVTARGRPFVRHVCARFDAYLGGTTAGRHSLSI